MSKKHEYGRKFDKSVYGKKYFEGDGSTSGYVSYMDAKGIVQDQFAIIDRVMRDRVSERTMLDVACAYGFGVQKMRELGWKSSGLDVSKYAIGRARELAPHLDFDVLDATELVKLYDKDKRQYGMITAIEFFEHIETEDAQKIIEGMYVLARGGYGVFVINASTYPDQPHDTDGDHGHLNHHPMEWWINEIAQYGQIDFEAMFEFSKAAEKYNAGVHWHCRCIVVKFD